MNTTGLSVGQRVAIVIARMLEINENRVVPTAKFARDLGVTKLFGMLLIIGQLGREFNLVISDANDEELQTVQDVINRVTAAIVRETIARELGIEEARVVATMSLEGDLGINEAAMAAIFRRLEARLDIAIPSQVAQQMGTVKDAINFVLAHAE